MASLLIAVIYLAFVSMGLPDALLGSVWPSIYSKLDVPLSYAGILTLLITSGTVVSSLLSNRLVSKFGASVVTVSCTLLTAVALFGFSSSSEFWHLCFWSLPYGLGAGSIDAALNNYVASHYKPRHMSWIHFSWGLGASAGPYLMAWALAANRPWTTGYFAVGIIQTGMTFVLLATLPLWNKRSASEEEGAVTGYVDTRTAISIPGVRTILFAFFFYCATEASAGLWASSYMAIHRGLEPQIAAKWASIFYLGITGGRFLLGFIADRIGNRDMVRGGQACAALGAILVMLPFGSVTGFAGLLLVGFGCAPIFPSLLHATPSNFGAANSQAIMGIQMACAYTGSAIMPPLLGFLGQWISIAIYPYFLLLLVAMMIVMTERVNSLVSANAASAS